MAQIGLQMYTMRKHVANKEEYAQTIKRIAEIGYRSIQVTKPGFFTDEEYIALLDQYGIKADSVFVPTGKIVEMAPAAAVQAQKFGCDVLRTDSIPAALRGSADGYKKYAEILNAEGKACRENGLRLIYHFHAFEWIRFAAEKTRGIDILLNETDPTAVFFQPDVFWLTSAGTEPSDSLKMFAGRAWSIHVKDYAIIPLEGKIENVPRRFASVGEGNLNWKGILATAKEIGIQRFVVEQDECDGDEFDAIATSFNTLRSFGLEA